MTKLKTHYDNLQVSQNASPEVISAAYRSLSRKYHPDLNPGSEQHERVMKIINKSYAVLSDPVAKRDHDAWIASREGSRAQDDAAQRTTSEERQKHTRQREAAAFAREQQQRHERQKTQHNTNSSNWHNPRREASFQERNAASAQPAQRWSDQESFNYRPFISLAAVVALIVLASLFAGGEPSKSDLPPYTSEPSDTIVSADIPQPTGREEESEVSTTGGSDEASPEPVSRAVEAAPNGSAWPKKAGYVEGYEKLNMEGQSSVTVDNSQNDSAVFVKVVSITSKRTRPVRQFFIPANSSFTSRKLSPGDYDVRYMNLADGSLARSEQFKLVQETDDQGVRFNSITMTLYRVPDGNMQTYPLNPSEF